ncbi:MAG: hypothetical protein AYK18_17575 [Theionarchaea archaeon DG-70]|nr:MAG: hypothetical protein AYK18_17575 [Theionarchaea archaeon DG-70]
MDPMLVIAVGSSFIFLLLIGVAFYRKAEKGYLNFLIANKDIPWPVLGFSLMASMIGASTFFAYPDYVKWTGFGGIYLAMWINTCFILPTMVIAYWGGIGRLRRGSIFSLFEDRYNVACRMGAAVFVAIFCIAGAGYTMLGVSYVMSLIFGVGTELGVLIALAVVLLYCFISGFYAICWTDFVQQILIMVTLVTIVVVGVIGVGGWHGIATNASINPPIHFGWTNALWFSVGLGCAYGLSNFIDPHIWQRVFAAKNVKAGMRSLSIWMVLTLIFWGLAMFVGLIAIAAFGETSRYAIFDLSKKFLPLGFMAILSAGVLAAVLSSADSHAIAGTTVLGDDFYRRALRPKASDREYLWVARIITVAILLTATLLAFEYGDILKLAMFAFSIASAGATIPFLAGMYWPRANSKGAIAGIVAGGLSTLLWEAIMYKPGLTEFPSLFFGLIVCAVFFFSVTLLTKPEYDKALKIARILGLKNTAKRVAEKANLELKEISQEEKELYGIVEEMTEKEMREAFSPKLMIGLLVCLVLLLLIPLAVIHP